MTTRGLTLAQLTETNPMRAHLAEVLRDEQRLGRVERASDGSWRASESLVNEFGGAFGYLGGPWPTTRKGDRP